MNILVEGRDGLTEAASRRVGSILNGKWRLDSLLGVGGTAAVYAATHRNGNRVAIKVLHTHFSLDEALRTRLQQEGYVANLVDHPGAVRIVDDDRAEDGSVFMVMELLSGEGLDARLKRKGWRLPRGEALGIVHALLDVLAAAHNKGVIHRDVKPDNVFVTREGQIKVLDFGIARLLDLPQNMSRTRNGALFGTLGFMAPEQALARTHEIDARTDLWAVGATLFTLLSGRLVHEAPTPNEQLVNAATRIAPPLGSILPQVDPTVAALVDKALRFHQVDRFQNAAQMQDAVRAIALDGPFGVSVLQGPRLSVEVDLPAIEVQGRWASSSLRPSMVRQPSSPPTMLTRPRRWARRLATAAAAGTILVAGALIERARVGVLPGAGQAAALRPALAATPTKAAFGPQPAAPDPAPAPDPVPTRDPAPTVPVVDPGASTPARPAPRPLIATGPVIEPLDPARIKRRPTTRRPVRSAATTTLPASTTPSIVDDDALWGRRH